MMSDIDFGDGSWEAARGVIQGNLQELVNLIKGNGKDGIKTTLESFIAEYRTNRKDNIDFQNTRDAEIAKREDRWRWRVGIVLAILTLVVSIVAILEANRQVHTGILIWPKIHHKTLVEPVNKVYATYQKPPETATW
jgi:hypothetical protein